MVRDSETLTGFHIGAHFGAGRVVADDSRIQGKRLAADLKHTELIEHQQRYMTITKADNWPDTWCEIETELRLETSAVGVVDEVSPKCVSLFTPGPLIDLADKTAAVDTRFTVSVGFNLDNVAIGGALRIVIGIVLRERVV